MGSNTLRSVVDGEVMSVDKLQHEDTFPSMNANRGRIINHEDIINHEHIETHVNYEDHGNGNQRSMSMRLRRNERSMVKFMKNKNMRLLRRTINWMSFCGKLWE
ncbi:hypothetical protein QL285_057606 [Trifolium repens]|nr:hypothetical protein QL285_057606 [Trifolium repens]